jgi:hypothetical protein
LARVAFEVVFGARFTVDLLGRSDGRWLAYVGGAIITALVLISAMWKPIRRQNRWLTAFGILTAAGLVVLAFFSRGREYWFLKDYLNANTVRYYLVSRVVIVVIALSWLLPWLRGLYAGGRRKRAVGVFVVLYLHVIYLMDANRLMYTGYSWEETHRLSEFLEQVESHRQKALHGADYEPIHQLEMGYWTPVVNIDSYLGRAEPPASGAAVRDRH